jgi:NADH-quinone oxidoreductase subunit J
MELILFALAALGALAGGVGVIASRLPVRSALALLLVLGSLSVLYLLLGAQFIAALQVIIYAGAIVVLFLFVIMLLHARSGEAQREKLRGQRTAAYLLGAGFLAVIATVLVTRPSSETAALPAGFGTAQAVGASLFTGYVLPFELASIILLVGIVAAVVIGAPAGGTR